jgi:hypothetical protein
MTQPNDIRTFLDIQNAVIDRAKLEGTDAEVRRQVQEKINTTYTKIAYEHFYTWSGETRAMLLPKKYATGTLTLTQGSDIITGVGSTWNENDHLYMKMQIMGQSAPFKIIRVASTTSITLDKPWLDASTSLIGYTIYQDEFGLIPDCQAVRKIIIPGKMPRVQPLACGPTEIDSYRSRQPFAGGSPTMYTVWGSFWYKSKTWATFNIGTDFWETPFTQKPVNLGLQVWPGIRNNDVWSSVRYTRVMYPMAADTDEPEIPFYNRAVLAWGTLVDHFAQNRDPTMVSLWNTKFREEHTKMASEIETYDDEFIIVSDQRKNIWSSLYNYQGNRSYRP